MTSLPKKAKLRPAILKLLKLRLDGTPCRGMTVVGDGVLPGQGSVLHADTPEERHF